MLIKGKISKQHDNFEIYKDCLLWKKKRKFDLHKDLYGKTLNRNWVAKAVFPIQILLIFGAVQPARNMG